MNFAVLVAAAFACAAARYFVIRYTRHAGVANAVAVAIVLAFVVGALSRPFGNAEQATAAADAPAVAVASAEPSPEAAGVPAAANPTDGPLTEVGGRCRGLQKPTATSGAGAIDYVALAPGTGGGLASGAQVDRARSNVLVGWAASTGRTKPASAVCLFLDGVAKPGVDERYGASRPDVANALGSPLLAKAGFRILIPAGTFSPGSHELSVAVISADGSVGTLAVPFTVNAK